jgi:hypothetical protein
MVDPTATLTLSVNSSFTDTFTAVIHSYGYFVSLTHILTNLEFLPATELIAGSKINPTHSLRIAGEISSMAATKKSTVTATA